MPKISELPEGNALQATDNIPVERGGTTYMVSYDVDETLYGAEQVDLIAAATHDWSWGDSRNFLLTTADQATITVNYPTGIKQGHQVSVVFQSTRVGGTTFDLSSMIDADGGALPDLVLAENESRRIIFGTTNALFVAALDYPTATTTSSGDFSSTKIDSNAGTITETLSASTNAGIVKLFTNIDVTNIATLAVQSGETLNGVTDGTFLFSNYTAGTQFRADEVSGGWVVGVSGASTQSDLHWNLWHSTGGGADVSVAVGADIPWSTILDTSEQSTGSSVTDDGTSITLPEGRWELLADLQGNSSTSTPRYRWHDGTNFVGSTGESAGQAASWSGETNAVAIIQGPATVTVRNIISGPVSYEGNNASVPSMILVKQLPATEAVLAGMVAVEDNEVFIVAGATTEQTANETITLPDGLTFQDLANEYEYLSVGVYSDSATNSYVAQQFRIQDVFDSPTDEVTLFRSQDGATSYEISIDNVIPTNTSFLVNNVSNSHSHFRMYGVKPQKTVINTVDVEVTPWTQFTPNIQGGTTDPVLGTHTHDCWYQVTGKTMKIKVDIRQTATGTSGVGTYLLEIPGGYTVNSNFITTGALPAADKATPKRVGFTSFVTDGTSNTTLPLEQRPIIIFEEGGKTGIAWGADDDGGAAQFVDENWYDVGVASMTYIFEAEIPLE